jgi:hypothetical protein
LMPWSLWTGEENNCSIVAPLVFYVLRGLWNALLCKFMSLFAVTISWLRFRPLCPHHTSYRGQGLAVGVHNICNIPPPAARGSLNCCDKKVHIICTIHSNFIEASRNHNRPTTKNVLRYLLSWNHSSTNNESYFSSIDKVVFEILTKKMFEEKKEN